MGGRAVPDPGCSFVSCGRQSRSACSDTGWPAVSEYPSARRSFFDDADPSPAQRVHKQQSDGTVKSTVGVCVWGLVSQTNLHLVHDGISAQDVVLLVRVTFCMLNGPSCLSTCRQANHHQDLKQVSKEKRVIKVYLQMCCSSAMPIVSQKCIDNYIWSL